MARLIARLGDSSTHGGVIITSASNTFCEGPLVARRGDLLACPIHGINPIISDCAAAFDVEGEPCALFDSITVCGARIRPASVNSFAE